MRWPLAFLVAISLLTATSCSTTSNSAALQSAIVQPTATANLMVQTPTSSSTSNHTLSPVNGTSNANSMDQEPNIHLSIVADQPPKPPVIHKHLVIELSAVPVGDVALTIDDGPTEYTQQIVNILAKYHVKATFFFVGNRIQMYPGAVAAAVSQGDAIGDHSVNHGNLTKMTLEAQTWEIVNAAHQIQTRDALPITLFRPPYEAYDDDTEVALAKNHMALALWNRDPRDWAAKTPEDIIHNVLSANPSGAVFDLHDTRMTMLALPGMIAGLQKQHLQLVVLVAPHSYTGVPVSD